MSENKACILSTRPLAHNTLLYAQEAGIRIDTESFIETKSIITPTVSKQIRGLAMEEVAAVFTSMNAAEAVIECLQYHDITPEWTIYTMGGTTLTILKDYFGSGEIAGTAINATELADTIVADKPTEVVFFCGNQRREELPGILHENKVQVNEVVVYETIETPVKIDKTYDGILFFSPSAVRSFFSANNVAAATVLFAIGTTTAQALRQHSRNKIMVGEFPEKESLAKKAIAYFSGLQ